MFAIAWRSRGRNARSEERLRLRAFALTVLAGALAYLAFYAHVFGQPSALAVYGGFPRDMAGGPTRAFAGLLLDRSFGLLFHAPVLVLALAGIVPLALRKREAWPHLALALAVIAPVLWWRMWWGGQCPPARFLVPLVPFLGLAVAEVVRTRRGLAHWVWPAAGLGLALALFMSARPGELLLLNRGDRPTRVWAALSGATPVARYLPSLVSGDADEWRVALCWAGALVLILGLDALARRHEAVDRLFRGLGLPLVVLLLLTTAVDRWARTAKPDAPGTMEGAATPLP